MATPYADWFISAAENKDLHLNPSELSILQTYLYGSLDLSDAISRLASPSQPQWDSTQAGRLWLMILLLAADHEEAHDDLVALLEGIFTLPAPSTSKEINWVEEKETGFPRSWRAMHDSLSAQRLQVKSFSDKVCKQWVNYHAFSARLLAASLLPGATYWALCLIVDALEKKVDLKKPTAKQDMDISAAAQYFIHAPRQILDNPFRDVDNTVGNVYSTAWGDESELWHGEGFSMERWTFWRKRFGELRMMESLSERATEGARRAEVGMEKTERQQGKKKKGK